MYASMDGLMGVLCMQVCTGQWEFWVCKYRLVNGRSVCAISDGSMGFLCMQIRTGQLETPIGSSVYANMVDGISVYASMDGLMGVLCMKVWTGR